MQLDREEVCGDGGACTYSPHYRSSRTKWFKKNNFVRSPGIRRVGRRPDQQGQPGSQAQGGQGEGRPGDKRPDRRPPRERRFEKPAEDKPEGGGGGGGGGGEFSADKWVAGMNDKERIF